MSNPVIETQILTIDPFTGMETEICSLELLVVPQLGDYLRIRESETAQFELYRVLTVTVEITCDPKTMKYRIVAWKEKQLLPE